MRRPTNRVFWREELPSPGSVYESVGRALTRCTIINLNVESGFCWSCFLQKNS